MPKSVRVTGLHELVAELTVAESGLLPGVAKVVERGAYNIKTDAQRRLKARKLKHLRAVPWSVSYDVFMVPGAVKAEIGPDTGKKQGNLAFVLEDGTPNSAPEPFMAPALDAEAPKFEAALLALTRELLP